MQLAESGAYEATGNTLRAVPIAVGGSTIFGYPWSDFVNILASVSIGLQILWFMYDKSWHLKERHSG